MDAAGHGAALEWLASHRCAWLFFGLLSLLIGLPYVGESMTGRIVGALLHDIILVAAAAVLSRSRRSLAVAVALAVPALGLQFVALLRNEAELYVWAWILVTAFYLLTLAYLLRYVLNTAAMSIDKLYGAAAAYLMLGVVWYYAYGIVQYFLPGAFAVHGTTVQALTRFEIIYFSFTVLTSTGFGDITATLPQTRSLANLESICGVLFVAILIARLVGVYPPPSKD